MSSPVTLITGASEGIGAELARVFAAKGHEVVLVARRGELLTALADQIVAAGGKTPMVVALDLSGAGAIETLAGTLAGAGRTVQYLVNNAGFGLIGRVYELDQAEQLAMIDLNIRTLTALTLRFLPELRTTRGGVLNVASVASFMPGPGFAVYYATKAYVRSFSEALAEELKPAGVRVSCLCPGPVETGFQSRAGMSFTGAMAAVKPALVPAAEVARQGYEGLMAGKRVVIPGMVNKALVWSARMTPRAVLLRCWRRRKRRSSRKIKKAGARPAFFYDAPEERLFFGRFDLQHLTAAIHAGLQIDVMRTAQLAGILVFDIGRGFDGVGGATEPALHRRGFSFRNSHLFSPARPTAQAARGREKFGMRRITPNPPL